MTSKRVFDFTLAILGLLIVGWLILILIVLARIDSKGSGFFLQNRVGQYGRIFQIYKIRSMHAETKEISRFGRFIRKFKLDELPQLVNIIKGEMSFVGPRPDIPGYYDALTANYERILDLRQESKSGAALDSFKEEVVLAT